MVQSLYSPLTDAEMWRRWSEHVHQAGEELRAGCLSDAQRELERADAIDQALLARHLR
jgi:hypothetical protein